ncbi:AGAP004118-PA [Pleodorina starrii]|uniref:AGAP004118-PA n=1 Tax=Pleodorina starrii TaxID=330485 RepID=A0A9W6F760_9CHLO|nr:AGAP004118-PA [Pleodorina starrii]
MTCMYVCAHRSSSAATATTATVVPAAAVAPIKSVLAAARGWKQLQEGRVEIFNGAVWGTVCDDGFGDREADVVCRELGYAAGVSVQQWGGGTGEILMDGVNCAVYPPPERLHQCSFRGWGKHDCSHKEDVGVRCLVGVRRTPPPPPPNLPMPTSPPPPPSPPSPPHPSNPPVLSKPPSSPAVPPWPPAPPPSPLYAVRLVGGSKPGEGRVEIFNGTVWGTVCDDYFREKEAYVVCRELGYDTGVAVQKWGGGTGPILMDNVNCAIYPVPKRLHQCLFDGWGIHNCGHQEDVGVQCAFFGG